MMQYKWEYNHFAGSLSFVTSRDQTRFGSVAISSGFCLAGWVPCERGDGMINHFSLSGMLLLVGSCPNRAESFPWIEITCLALSNSRSSRAFPIRSRATSLTDRLAGRAPNGRAGAARAQVMAWWRGGVVAPGAHERGVGSFAAKQSTAAFPVDAVIVGKDVAFAFSVV